MSNRILKQSICTSESIDQLDWFEEVFYYRLIVNVDDYGVYDARPKILKASLFPLREVKLQQIEKAIASLSSKGLIHLYTVEGRPFLNLPSWAEHQRVRNSKHKFPTPDQADPPQSAESCGELRRVAASCGESPQSAESCGLTRARAESRIQNPESIIHNPESVIDCTELPDGTAAQSDPATEPEADVPALILNDGSEWRPLAKDVSEWREIYPGVDIKREFARMRQWCMDNPRKRKTRTGIRKFARSWIDREQNRGWRSSPNNVQEPTGVDAAWQMMMEGRQ